MAAQPEAGARRKPILAPKGIEVEFIYEPDRERMLKALMIVMALPDPREGGQKSGS